MAEARAVSLEWGDWMNRWDWQAWCTLTFRDEGYTHEAATRSWLRLVGWLQREGSPDASWFVGHEIGARGRLHIHALLGGLSPYTQRRAVWSWWFKRYGRAQVLDYHPKLGAAHYVAKYVTKEMSHYDLDLRGIDQRWASQMQLQLRPAGGTWLRQRNGTA